ncbi:AmmeMemoRadiSam system protein B [Aggregatilinea lenta]|uniref:AmmeMemoRadiSam system protein B n=1 Tax=Aggregatilinea lenta TaxID=913108 RepID=UPI000E5ABA9D|nr:AmmeMemoRadiSam system protein B [Aggregatilinea lenta]
MTAAAFQDIRPSPLAGRWYPANPEQLAQSVDRFMSAAPDDAVPGRPIGLLAPHAGHRYSGPVAGCAFRAVQGMAFDVVAVLGPSHYPYAALLLTSAHDAFQTPLGAVPIDRVALAAFTARVPAQAVRDDPEHAIEIELPFLQRALQPGFALLPLALIDQSLDAAQQIGEALAQVLTGRKALLVASSDLSHFYPQATAHSLDHTLLDTVDAFDPAAVLEAERTGTGFACGHGAIAAVMVAARALGADTAQVVGYATSGDATGDMRQVVGYGAAVFSDTRAAQPESE